MATVNPAAPGVRTLPDARTGRPPRQRGGAPRGLVVMVFMFPAALLLGAIVVYPAVATVARSLYDRDGSAFVGAANYRALFGATDILIAIRNNAIWVIVFPFLVTFLGLVFAVLTERIRWATAFKAVVFMPMAISLFATGVIWRIVYETDPHRGVINSAVATVVDAVHPAGAYALPNIKPISGVATAADGGMLSTASVQRGGALKLGLTGIPLSAVPPGAVAARAAAASGDAVAGLIWRDFSPGGHIGVIDSGEKGLPGMHLSLLQNGNSVATATSGLDGTFRFAGVGPGSYRVSVDPSNFKAPFSGVNWLGTQTLTPVGSLGPSAQAVLAVPLVDLAAIMAMLWMWSGFAMVVIGAGLAALNREVLEAARMDGASELQTFRHITLPLLRPVLIVVFITMIINVLKIFDIILALVPDSAQQQANVIALKMYQVGFTGGQNRGLSSALAVFLFVLVVPVIFLNVRRIKG